MAGPVGLARTLQGQGPSLTGAAIQGHRWWGRPHPEADLREVYEVAFSPADALSQCVLDNKVWRAPQAEPDFSTGVRAKPTDPARHTTVRERL